MSLAPATRTRIETLLRDNPVVLFMKGSPQAPQCGFSAATSGVLNELLPEYASVNVLEDAEMREGIKEYGNWPTIPQLYVKGELVGGADIVQAMYNAGELQALFGLPQPDRTPPSITITDQAAQAIRSALADAEPGLALHLTIDARFQPQFHLAEPGDDAIRSESNGIDVLFDLGSAQRARGIRIDWVETMQGAGLSIDNPNAPSTVKQLSVAELAQRLAANEAITIVDVRPPEERAQAALKHAFRTLDDGIGALADLPKDAPIAFLCRSGGRSQRAAEQFHAHGYTKVYNIAGGINAWAREIDPTISQY
ncbi:MAG: Grx4 family monothiol glutaredoxin [Rudaea sp.]|uniref:Grx4 family monothiol glutaredoxin n=1 Tax=unclassified Rudaea TaxID=2627037 RepID=UPI0010F5EA11|nr:MULTISPECIES: Grx4 family monothiol glutaredoxin [unclassified Rudaea]MBN8885243.1 Grx4 family monothiol glutaredoxin [Rudaea sp.]